MAFLISLLAFPISLFVLYNYIFKYNLRWFHCRLYLLATPPNEYIIYVVCAYDSIASSSSTSDVFVRKVSDQDSNVSFSDMVDLNLLMWFDYWTVDVSKSSFIYLFWWRSFSLFPKSVPSLMTPLWSFMICSRYRNIFFIYLNNSTEDTSSFYFRLFPFSIFKIRGIFSL